MRKLLVNLISFYQAYLSFDGGLLSYFAPTGACRYEISCSEYTKRAILNKGVAWGIFKGIRRIISCR